ncbi:flagellar hook-length control protein FliK [Hyphomicrobium sp.]|uniref:flagellar hook-length control protein FliK n=1 Tax=Hyphomicrobium sp. TaxID=82 RepID=UPI0025B99899|nr:flagellar hook-length control protein FliK [Hyphomicrobium sp.]MCC7251464.1 flagellar hook-length control protein FliK [Hyphomicrobium sp.]
MSAAQAVTSGLPASSPSVRPVSGGAETGQRDASFRDALDTASRSRGAGDDRGDDAAGNGEGASPRAEPAGAVDLSAILAQLGGAARATEEEVDIPVLSGSVPAVPTGDGTVGETGPWLPGQVGEHGESLDAEPLLALLKSGGTSASGEAAPEVLNIKVTVAGQETHLAVDRPSDAFTSLAPAQEPTKSASSAQGEGKTAALGATLSQAMDEAARSSRLRGSGAAAEVGSKADTATGVPRVAAFADETAGKGGATALADQSISGQEGRQQEGRGSSGAGAQQQATGAFLSMMAGAAPRAGAVASPADAGVPHESVSDQIAAEVRSELRAHGLSETSSDGVVKVLHLELKPANLGSVTVRIALKENAVTIHLEAQRLDTLAVIESEREALVSALASAGYTVDGVTTAPQSEASRSLASLAGFGEQGAAASQGGSQGQGQGLSDSSGGQGRPGQAGSGNPADRHPSDDKDVGSGGVRRAAGGIYV